MRSAPLKTHAIELHKGSFHSKMISLPSLEDGDLLLRLLSCGVCSGEAMGWYIKSKKNSVLGHEIVGEVIDTKGKTPFKVGDRVFPHHHASCGLCAACKSGLESNCSQWKQTHLVPGGYSEYILVPSSNVLKDTYLIPSELSNDQATFIEPLGCCYRALNQLKAKPHQKVLIVGLGIMGQLLSLVFSSHLDTLLLASDFLNNRREMIESLAEIKTFGPMEDAKSIFNENWGQNYADIVILCPSSHKAIEQGLSYLGPGSTLLLFSPPPPNEKTKVDFSSLYFKEIQILSSYSAGTADCQKGLEFSVQIKDKLEKLISHRWPLTKLERALNAIKQQDENYFKIVLHP